MNKTTKIEKAGMGKGGGHGLFVFFSYFSIINAGLLVVGNGKLIYSLKFFHYQCRAACGRKGKTYLFFLLFSIINAELPVINRPSHWSSPFITAHFLYWILSSIFVIFFIIIIILVIFFCSALGNVFSYDPSLQHFIWSISFHKVLRIKDFIA